MKQLHILSVIALSLLLGCGRQPDSKRVLVTTYVEKASSRAQEVLSTTNVSKISFIALSGHPISVSLPLGEEYNCSACFQLRVGETAVQVSEVFLSFGGRKDRWLFPDDEPSAYEGPHQVCGGSTANGLAETPIELARWAYGRNDVMLNFKTLIVVEPLKSEAMPRPMSGYEYEGRLYHMLQNADPRNMRHGK